MLPTGAFAMVGIGPTGLSRLTATASGLASIVQAAHSL
jgi:hypothetical protein